MLRVWLRRPILERKRIVPFNSFPPSFTPSSHSQSSSQPRSKRELNFKFVSDWSMKRLGVEFEAYAQPNSYDSLLVSQPPMSSSSSSSQLRPTLGLLTPSLDFFDVEPVARPWKDIYSERSTVERNWCRSRYSVRTLQGHTDGVTCLQFSETLQHNSFRILITCDRTVRVWNIEASFEVRRLLGHMRAVRAL
jgi:F-box/WD-40 domain protein MET30